MKSLFGMVYFQKFLNVVLLQGIIPVNQKGILAVLTTCSGHVLRGNEEVGLRVKLIHDKNIGRERMLRTIGCMLLCLLGISRVSFAQQEDNLLRQEYQTAMEQHVQDMIAALSMYSSDIYYENENVLRTRRVKLIRVFFRSEQAKIFDFLKIGVETEDNYLNVMEFLKTIPVVLPRVTFNMNVEEISPYVRLANGEFKLPVKVGITFVDLNTGQERTMPSKMYNVYCWQSENGDFTVSSMDLLREQRQTLSGATTGLTSGKTYKEYEKMADEFYDKKNYTEALKYYKLSASGNDGGVFNRLGYMYFEGLGVNVDVTEAVKWFRKSAEQGYMYGQYNLGLMYELGRGVEKDVNEAIRWYRKATDQGYQNAKDKLAKLSDPETTLSKTEIKYYVDKADKYYEEKNYQEALKNYLIAANAGDAYAQLWVGFMYTDAEWVGRNYEEAWKWFLKSAENGNVFAMNSLGGLYCAGDGIPKDYVKAMKWYRKAAEAGDAYGQCNLACMYQYGLGVPKNIILAKQWYEKAAAQNYSDAMNELGNIYYDGNGIAKDYAKAMLWYEKVAAQNYSDAMNELGNIYHDGNSIAKDYAKAMQWYRKAADQGNMYGEFNIGLLYEFGYGVTKNLDEATKWYRRAANRGMERAKTKLKELGR